MYSTTITKPRRLRIWIAIWLAIAFTGLYVYLYQTDPFPAGVTDLVTSGMVVMAALAAAVISILIMRRYGRNSPPRLVWLNFSLALWGWAIAEAVWTYEYAIDGAYALGPADVFWVISYFFFIAALYRQYTLIYRPTRLVRVAYLLLSIVAVLIFTYLYALWLSGTNDQPLDTETLVNAFYVAGDSGLAIAALLLTFAFRDGALGRPWIGLVVFAFSDLLYSLLETSGLYTWSIAGGNLLTTISDTSYLAAYLVVAFGCYLQWLLLFYGPRLKYDQST
jgi:hypothetical protein